MATTPKSPKDTSSDVPTLAVVTSYALTGGWEFARLEDDSMAVIVSNEEPYHIPRETWDDMVRTMAIPAPDADLPVDIDADDMADVKQALRWVLDKLTHPGSQWDLCDTHGKVPLTHQCSTHTNADFQQALKAAE